MAADTTCVQAALRGSRGFEECGGQHRRLQRRTSAERDTRLGLGLDLYFVLWVSVLQSTFMQLFSACGERVGLGLELELGLGSGLDMYDFSQGYG